MLSLLNDNMSIELVVLFNLPFSFGLLKNQQGHSYKDKNLNKNAPINNYDVFIIKH